jgi:hypothetical protein
MAEKRAKFDPTASPGIHPDDKLRKDWSTAETVGWDRYCKAAGLDPYSR